MPTFTKELAAMEARISKHMNDDHSDSLLAWAHFYAKLPTATHATATTLTDQGFGLDVKLANGTVTPVIIPFDPPLKSASDVRKVAVAMHFAAYNALGFRYKLTMGFYSGVARMAWTHMPARIKLGLVGFAAASVVTVAACVFRLRPALPPPPPVAFVPAEAFAGSRAGYIFKMGSTGLGYYLDSCVRPVMTAASKNKYGFTAIS